MRKSARPEQQTRSSQPYNRADPCHVDKSQHRYRVYIGEAEDLNRRLRPYGGRADEKLNQREMTIRNMRGRIRRTCRAGGIAVACLLGLPVKHLPEREALDPHCKDCRIVLQRLALSAAYLRGEPVGRGRAQIIQLRALWVGHP